MSANKKVERECEKLIPALQDMIDTATPQYVDAIHDKCLDSIDAETKELEAVKQTIAAILQDSKKKVVTISKEELETILSIIQQAEVDKIYSLFFALFQKAVADYREGGTRTEERRKAFMEAVFVRRRPRITKKWVFFKYIKIRDSHAGPEPFDPHAALKIIENEDGVRPLTALDYIRDFANTITTDPEARERLIGPLPGNPTESKDPRFE